MSKPAWRDRMANSAAARVRCGWPARYPGGIQEYSGRICAFRTGQKKRICPASLKIPVRSRRRDAVFFSGQDRELLPYGGKMDRPPCHALFRTGKKRHLLRRVETPQKGSLGSLIARIRSQERPAGTQQRGSSAAGRFRPGQAQPGKAFREGKEAFEKLKHDRHGPSPNGELEGTAVLSFFHIIGAHISRSAAKACGRSFSVLFISADTDLRREEPAPYCFASSLVCASQPSRNLLPQALPYQSLDRGRSFSTPSPFS